MRTTFAFVLGAALVSATWVFAGPAGQGTVALHPAPDGPAVQDGLGEPVADFGWQGAGGRPAHLQELLGEGPVIVVIRDMGCPVSQRYGANLRELEEALAGRDVRFLYVDLTPDDVRWSPRIPQEQAGLTGTWVRQVDETFFEALRPRTTTEAFLIDRDGTLRYRGAVDDQFGIDFARQAPRERYLQEAVGALLAGRTPTTSSTFAPGCYLESPPAQRAATRERTDPAPLVTFHGGHAVPVAPGS